MINTDYCNNKKIHKYNTIQYYRFTTRTVNQ